ncbi:MAG: hypothetical protein E7679_06995 [Ruminococcaceae bacterium]|nr:hypothetical protein [Oscillospiraceae bacterium]
MSKKLIKILAIVLVICLLIGIPKGIYRYKIRTVTNTKVYLTQKYVKYNYGKDAEVFFNDYAYTENYKDIAFHYCDAEKIISLYNTWTVFVLDVYYDKAEFDNVLDKLTFKINRNEPDSTTGGFLVYSVKDEDDVYKNNSAFVLIDSERNTVRYVLVCDHNDASPYKLYRYVDWTFNDIKWNHDDSAVSHDDWIFDYSQ